MRDTSSSSLKKLANPFYTPSHTKDPHSLKDSHSLIAKVDPTRDQRYPPIPKRIASKPVDITNLHFDHGTPKRSQPLDNSKMDVYTRLYNDSKTKASPQPYKRTNHNGPEPHRYANDTAHVNQSSTNNLQAPPHPLDDVGGKRGIRRTFSSFQLEKQISKVETVSDLYQIIYDEDQSLFEDPDVHNVTTANPRAPQEFVEPNVPEGKSNSSLDIYERGEILRRKDIYFVPDSVNDNQRRINIRNHNNNYGFDDNAGNYVIIPNDHINYRYEIVSVLGNGSFGNVVKCKDKKFFEHQTGKNKTVAIKIIKNDLNWSLQSVYEIKMLKHLNRKKELDTGSNVTTTYDSEYGDFDCPVLTYFDHFHFRGHMCIVTEALSINLYSMLEIIKFQGLSLQLLKSFTREILEGLKYIHSMNVLHCDIKPENIMLKVPANFPHDPLSGDSLVLKIVDFGASCFTNEVSYSYIQSRFYRAPEVILGAKYGKMIDIWSLGCIIAELFTGDPLLPGKNELEQIGLILELFGNPSCSLILQQRNNLRKSIKGKKATSRFNEGNLTGLDIGGIADEKSIKKTLLYTLFDMEGKINMQFLNMRIQAAGNNTMHPSTSKKVFKISSKNLETRLRLRSCNEDKRNASLFLKFLNSIFKWSPEERADCTQLLEHPFLAY